MCSAPLDPDRQDPDSLLLLLISFEVLIVRFDPPALILGATAIEAEGQRLPAAKRPPAQDQFEGRRWKLLVRSERGKAAQVIVAGKRRYKGGAFVSLEADTRPADDGDLVADCGAGLLLNDGRK
ncbi:hypothetical protein X747_23205 [Mesorhizobium sp. LNJC384A00]|nr:hypothetical protein X765_31205 [Mesorhizobium sp. LSHC440B00]ESX33482.1 hypothetical protein X763_25760 [Mesorhizobium sp. LSHC432A00]ESX34129.1 hypothetical protein X764_28720 [Mesorhizobium sp. LSHC440A00]ESX80048.1 hypothetical protein X757_04770 [Mesorhizobium sp. LSHC414A00]ESY17034.1 hypothetical protein X749_31185 [Mesorhizobium sp. LNJC391B00]ESY39672.1 hypothetical protein X747_23205 [Mesorhizobium sp. LNJC384A00]ESZ36509.1 hypothetical protein X732_23385 [Mesorhizobium sp. L2C06